MAASASSRGEKDAVKAFEMIQEFSKVSMSAATQKPREIIKMVCVVEDLLGQMAQDLLEKAGDRPVMQHYSSDGTSKICPEFTQSSLDVHPVVVWTRLPGTHGHIW